MRMLIILCLSLIYSNLFASDIKNCNRENPESLWVEEYSCEHKIKVQVSHEIINPSIIINEDRAITKHKSEIDNKINMEYLKLMRQVNN